MDVAQAIISRSSCRRFLDQPVDKSILEDICGLALSAPSALNLQPWLFTGVMGEELARLARSLSKAFGERRVSCGADAASPLPPKVPGPPKRS